MKETDRTPTELLSGQTGTTLFELLVALLVFSGIVLGILPVMHQASRSDLGSQSMTQSSYVASQIMETLKIYRTIQNTGGVIPDELAAFAVAVDPYEIDGNGVWTTLGVDAERFAMSYVLSAEPTSGRLIARVSVTTVGAQVNQGGGGNRWVEFSSSLE